MEHNLPFLKPGASFITDPINRFTLFVKRTPQIKHLVCPHYAERTNPVWWFTVHNVGRPPVMCEVERSAKRFYLRVGPRLVIDSHYHRGQSLRLEQNILAL